MNVKRKKQVSSCRESWIWGNWQCKFYPVVSEVSSFVGNPVSDAGRSKNQDQG